jgi:hypothetical protein
LSRKLGASTFWNPMGLNRPEQELLLHIVQEADCPELVRIFCTSITKLTLLKMCKKVTTECFDRHTKHIHALHEQNVEFVKQVVFVTTAVLYRIC